MSWKKNWFGNLMWVVYALGAVAALAGISGAAVKALNFGVRPEQAAAVLPAALAVICALLLHRMPVRYQEAKWGGVRLALLCEAVFTAAFLALGFCLRADRVQGIQDGGACYEMALVAEGKRIPFLGHGAEYLYLQLLHAVFLFLGNKLAAGIWLQVILQFLAVLVLYFGVRKLAGVLPAMVMLVFFMCMEPMVLSALVLSPEPLFFLLFACGFELLATCRESGRGAGAYLTAGLWVGMTGYLDVTAFLLTPVGMAAVMETGGEKTAGNKRFARALALLTGIVAGFAFCLFLVSSLRRRPFMAALKVWTSMFAPGEYEGIAEIPESGLPWLGALAFLLCLGVVGYWFSREKEYVSGWTLTVCLAVAVWYTGITNVRIPVFPYLLLLLTVLAGAGMRSCLRTGAAFEDRKAKTVLPMQAGPKASGSIQPPEGPKQPETETKAAESVQPPEGPKQPEPEAKAAGAGQPPESRKQPETEPKAAGAGQLPEGPKQPEPEAKAAESVQKSEKPPRFLENPLPLPKPHRKKVLDYDAETDAEDDFDHPVDENDDFDIK